MPRSTLLSLLDRQALPSTPVPARFAGLPVLVTGAGGSVGRALTLRLAAEGVSPVILLELSEGALHSIVSRLRELRLSRHVTPVLGDAGDTAVLDDVLRTYRPGAIFHMAAFKHVALLEQQPFAAVHNNAVGSDRLVLAAARHGVADVILLSTDKAVRPTSVMGVTKRVAELLFINAATAPTRFTSVRLANVLGSSGSVLPIMRAQIRRGQPLRITHPDATRSFVTASEAVDLVLGAATLSTGGDLYAPDLGPGIRIVDLALRLKAETESDAPLTFTGLQPGEKLAEQLWADAADRFATAAPPLLRIVEPDGRRGDLPARLAEIAEVCRRRDLPGLVKRLRDIVPDYHPSATVVDGLHARAVGV